VSPSAPVISIVIVTYNSVHYIKECLAAIEAQKEIPFEIILVDNNSKDTTVQIVKEEFPFVKIIVNNKNLGYAHANNQGIEQAAGKYVLLLNPDTQFTSGALYKMIKFMDSNSQYSGLAPKLLNPDGTIQSSLRELPSYEILLWEFTGLSRIFPKHRRFARWRMGYFDYNLILEVDQPMASCLLLKKAVFDQIGYFDETFPFFYNDVDLSKRMKLAGLTTIYFPQVEVYHHRGASTRLVRSKMIWDWHIGLFRYFKKYNSGLGFFFISIPLGLVLLFGVIFRIAILGIKKLFNKENSN
jgi:GT2 family glycosyltransferase